MQGKSHFPHPWTGASNRLYYLQLSLLHWLTADRVHLREMAGPEDGVSECHHVFGDRRLFHRLRVRGGIFQLLGSLEER